MPGNKLLVSITPLLLRCTYRLQQRAASVCVAGCGGATRPVAGGSDWGCWDCAAASRTGCPNGLAVRDDKQSHTADNTKIQTHEHKHVTKDTRRRTRTQRCGEDGRDRKTGRQDRQKIREGGRQERSQTRHEKFSPRGESEKQRELWEKQKVCP